MNKECESSLKHHGVTSCEEYICSHENKKISGTVVKVMRVEDLNCRDAELRGLTFDLTMCMRDKMKEILGNTME